jgi:dihydroorotate dehydrogenase
MTRERGDGAQSRARVSLTTGPLSAFSIADRLLFRPLGPELGHKLALIGLGARFAVHTVPVSDSWPWRGLVFPNRVGVAAGFDKNGWALSGLAEIGAGFAEVGTILTRPWPGNLLRPRMARLEAQRGIWNRLGFPSIGAPRVAQRLARFRRSDIVLGCNIAPHPLTIRVAGEPGFAQRVYRELEQLVEQLHPWARFFVVNMSSPNTSGLRGVLYGEGFAQEIVAPLRARIAQLSRERGHAQPTPLLVKLPPEDPDREPWTATTLRPLVGPLAHEDVCDGYVAVNTSIGLALKLAPHARPDAPGGVSGAPLLPLALGALRALSEIALPEQLRIGVGGITQPEDALAMIDAGANLVELYSGLIYQGPTLIGACADALRERAELTEYGLPPRADRERLRGPSSGVESDRHLSERLRASGPK